VLFVSKPALLNQEEELVDKFNELSLGEKLISVGGVLLFFFGLLFDWWHVSVNGFGSGGTKGFDDPGMIWSTLAILIALALAGSILAIRLGKMTPPTLPSNLTWGQVYGGGAALVVVLMLLKAWRIMEVPVGGFGIGYILGAIATGAIAYGGYLLYSSEKTGFIRQ
jgi:hypothetical protein